MYIFNITFVVEPKVENEWQELLKKEFLPQLGGRATSFFRVLGQHYAGHFSYSLQINCDTMKDYSEIDAVVQSVWGESCAARFGEQVMHFATLLKQAEL